MKDIIVKVDRSEVENMDIGEIEEGIDFVGEMDEGMEIESIDGFADFIGKMVHRAVKQTIHVAKFVATHNPAVVAVKVTQAATKPFVKAGVHLAQAIIKNPTPVGIAKAIIKTQREMAKHVIKRAYHRKIRKFYRAYRRRGVPSRKALHLAHIVVKRRYAPKYRKAYHVWLHKAKLIAKRVGIMLKKNPHLIKKIIPLPHLIHRILPPTLVRRKVVHGHVITIPIHRPPVRIPIHRPPVRIPIHRPPVRRRIPIKTNHIIRLFPPQTRYALRIIALRYRTARTPEEKERIHLIAKKFFGRMLIDFIKKPEEFSNKFARMKREKWIRYAYKHAPIAVKKAFKDALKKAWKIEMAKKRRIAREKILLNLLKRNKITYEQYIRLRNRYKYSKYLRYLPKKDLHKLYLETLKRKQMALARKRALMEYKRKLMEMKKKIEMEKEKLKQEKLKMLLRMKKLEQQRRLLQRKIDYWKKKMAIQSMRQKAKYYQQLYKQKQKYIELEKQKLQKELDLKRKQYIQMLKAEIAKLKREKERILKELEETKREIAKMKVEKHRTPNRFVHPSMMNIVKRIIYTIGDNGISETDSDVESINLDNEE